MSGDTALEAAELRLQAELFHAGSRVLTEACRPQSEPGQASWSLASPVSRVCSVLKHEQWARVAMSSMTNCFCLETLPLVTKFIYGTRAPSNPGDLLRACDLNLLSLAHLSLSTTG